MIESILILVHLPDGAIIEYRYSKYYYSKFAKSIFQLGYIWFDKYNNKEVINAEVSEDGLNVWVEYL